MTDLQNPRVIVAKGFLFLLLGALTVGILIVRVPRLDVAVLTMIAVWSFCRFYYFAFYVIQHYVDPDYRFAGLIDFARYMSRRRRK